MRPARTWPPLPDKPENEQVYAPVETFVGQAVILSGKRQSTEREAFARQRNFVGQDDLPDKIRTRRTIQLPDKDAYAPRSKRLVALEAVGQ